MKNWRNVLKVVVDEVKAYVDSAVKGVEDALTKKMDEHSLNASRAMAGLPPLYSDERLAKGIADYLRANPISVPQVSDEQIDRAVAERTRGLQERVGAAVDAYMKANPIPEPKPGKDGRDVTDEQLARTVSAYMAAHPIREPQDGKSVTLEDVRPFIEAEIAKAALGYERHAQGILQNAVANIAKPENVTKEQVAALCREQLAEAIATLPPAKDGAPGKQGEPGKNATDEQVAKAVAVHLKAHPPEPGRPGADATPEQIADAVAKHMAEYPVKHGEAGRDATDEQVWKAVERYLTANPPKDGKPGANGKSVTPEDIAAAVTEYLKDNPPKDGEDGKSLTLADIEPLVRSLAAEWALDFERRATDTLHQAIDKIPTPKDGVDGRDCLDIDSFDVQWDEHERTMTVILERGEDRVEKTVRIPVPMDRGVYREGSKYMRGDGVTFGGSWWIAQKDDARGKPGKSQDWRLAVRHGRDAKSKSGE